MGDRYGNPDDRSGDVQYSSLGDALVSEGGSEIGSSYGMFGGKKI